MSYMLDTVVSKEEQSALKEMIFKRAQERADALNQDVQASYTSSVQNDIMFSARNSFVSQKNPFSLITPEKKETLKEFSAKENIINESKAHVEEIKAQIYNKNKIANKELTESTMLETMNAARVDFERKSSFMGALNFLNSQASISLIKSKGKSFEALA